MVETGSSEGLKLDDTVQLASLSMRRPRSASDAGLPLRDVVLGGRFFGERHREGAAAVAHFLHGTLDVVQALQAWFGHRLAGIATGGRDSLRGALDRDIAAIDATLGRQIDAILHMPRLRDLEGRWRGLAWLVEGLEPNNRRLKVKVQTVRWAELCRDLERALEFDQSLTFRRIYEEEFGHPGGEPFGLMVIDHALRHRPSSESPTDDIGGIELLSAVAAAAFMPVILSLDPSVLEVERISDLDGVRDVTLPLRDSEHVRWRALAGRADMRFVGVALPRLLARHPWRDDPSRIDGFRYQEYAPDSDSRVWMCAGWAFAACALRAFAENRWPADVRGVELDRVGGGLVTDLPPEPFASGPPLAWPRTAVEYRFSSRQEEALVGAGLMPVTCLPFGSDMVFGSVRSMQAPPSYTGVSAAAAEANARLSSQINSILCASRFAHLLKVMVRDKVGSVTSAENIQDQLNRWLLEYVNTNVDNTTASRARFPLIEGKVQVQERPDQPGSFRCIMHLRPHYQLDEISTTFHLVTDIAPARSH